MQANAGAKNHAVILPDAHPEATTAALTGASMGAAGQRCMAISAAVFVGGLGQWEASLRGHAARLKLGPGTQAGVDVGPLISPESKARVERLIASAEQQVVPGPAKSRLAQRSLQGICRAGAAPGKHFTVKQMIRGFWLGLHKRQAFVHTQHGTLFKLPL